MPRTFGERLFAALALCAILVLVGVALTRGSDNESMPDPPPPALPDPPPPPVTATTTTGPRPQAPPPPPPPPAATTAVLVVRATRGPSLVSIRTESEDGASLHEGVLARGETVRVSGDNLWIRLGQASNVDLTLNDRPVERLPPGPIDLVATADTIQAEA